MTTAREWLDAQDAVAANMDPLITTVAGGGDLRRYDATSIRATANGVPLMVAALRDVLDPETVEAIARAMHDSEHAGDMTRSCPFWDEAATAHAALVARIEAALGVTS